MKNVTFDLHSPEIEARVESPVALLLIQPSEGIFGKTVAHQQVQVTVPLDLNANNAPLRLIQEQEKHDSQKECPGFQMAKIREVCLLIFL